MRVEAVSRVGAVARNKNLLAIHHAPLTTHKSPLWRTAFWRDSMPKARDANHAVPYGDLPRRLHIAIEGRRAFLQIRGGA